MKTHMLLLCAWVFTFMLSACDRTPDEEQVANAINEIAELIEQKKTQSVLNYLSDDFNSDAGHDKKRIHQLLAFHALRNQSINVALTNIDVHLDEQFADVMIADFNALLTGGSGLLPERGQLYAVKTKWHRQGDDWKLSRAQWEKLLN